MTQSYRSTLVVSATGLGKTVMAAALANHFPQGRVMLISHRYELNMQGLKTFERYCGEEVDLEQAAYRADQRARRCRIVVASVMTLVSKRRGITRMTRFRPDEFGLLIIDEAHHAVSPSYMSVLEHFQQNPNLRVVGLTATPDRLDGIGLGHVFEHVSVDYNITWGVENGWLVAPEQEFIEDRGLDLSDLKTKRNKYGERDLDERQIAQLLEVEEQCHKMVVPIMDIAGDRQTIIYTASVAQARKMAELINYRYKPDSAVMVDGRFNPMHTERRRRTNSFLEGDKQFFVNCEVATEGFDAPDASVIAVCRPTASRALYTQMVGRGLRVSPTAGVEQADSAQQRLELIASSDKPCCTVLDFVGQSGKHHLVCTGDLLAGDTDPQEVVDQAVRFIRGGQYDGKMVDALRAAREKWEKQRAQQRAGLTVGVRYARHKSGAGQSYFDPDVTTSNVPAYMLREPTEKMCHALGRFGYRQQEVASMNYLQAKNCLDRCIQRARNRLCTVKQGRLLERFGFDPEPVSFEQASLLITAIKNAGWQRPPESIYSSILGESYVSASD